MTIISRIEIPSFNKPILRGIEGYDIVRVILGIIILIAAVFKGHQLATEPVAGKTFLESRWFLMAQVEFELAFGLVLLSGLYKRMTWLLAIVCFSCFSLVTLYKGLSGQSSCGCFGKIAINPWYTLIFDLLAITALIAFRPVKVHLPYYSYRPIVCVNRRRVSLLIALILLVGLPAGYAMASFQPATFSDDGLIAGESNFVAVEPEKWIGKSFPLLKYIDIGTQLEKGKWIVVFYHYDCPRCREAIPKYEDSAKVLATDWPRTPRIALVELPPYAKIGQAVSSQNSLCVPGYLTNKYEWFIETPKIISLNEGKVDAIGRRNSLDESFPTSIRTLLSLFIFYCR